MSTSLSPNSHFLQQHLPPTFPLSTSTQPSPEAEIADALALPAPPFHAAQVILTPTTREWRELKEIGRLEGDNVPDSDSDSGSPSPTSPGSGKKATVDGIDYFNTAHKDRLREEPITPDRPVFEPLITAPSPLPPQTKESEVDVAGTQLPSVVLQDIHGNAVDEDPTLSLNPSLGFASIGRRDSLRLKTRSTPPKAPKTKTKRELERERLFKMVDQEIAETGDTLDRSHTSWNVRGVGSGSGLDSRTGGQGLHSPDIPPIEPEKKWVEEEPVKVESPTTTPEKSERSRSPEPASERSPSHSPEVPRTLPSASIISATPVRPSPLQTTSILSTAESDESIGSDLYDLTSQNEGPKSPPPETQVERYEAIRHYARQLSTRKSLGSGPSRPPSRAPSRRGSDEADTVASPRSPRRRDTLRVSLVAGRVVKPAEFPAIQPLTPTPGSNILSPKATLLQSFSPFQRSSPPTTRPPLLRGVSGSGSYAGSYASSIVAPSECATPTNEPAAGGVGGHGIDDYVILKEAGKGAYGLVMRAKVKGAKGEPVGVSTVASVAACRDSGDEC